MIQKSADTPIVSGSTAVYELLLLAYPARFRREYGPHMRQVFRDCCLRSIRQKGGVGMLELWVITLVDVARSALQEHAQKETKMSNPSFIRLSGWAFIAGALCFIAVLSGTDPIAFPSSIAAAILLAVGLLGLRARYGERAGGFGRSILLIGVIAMPLPYLALLIMALAAQGNAALRLQLEGLMGQGLWVLLFTGPAIVLLALTLFGLVALWTRPMPRLNWLPIAAGIWYPAILFTAAGYIWTHYGAWWGEQYQIAMIAMLVVQFFALLGLGGALLDDISREPAMA